MTDNIDEIKRLPKVKVKLAEYDKPQISGRVYSEKCLDEAFNNELLTEKMKNNSLFMTFGDESFVNSIAGAITDIYKNKDDKCYKAEVQLLDTPSGRLMNTLLECYGEDSLKATVVGYGDTVFNEETGLDEVREMDITSFKFFK